MKKHDRLAVRIAIFRVVETQPGSEVRKPLDHAAHDIDTIRRTIGRLTPQGRDEAVSHWCDEGDLSMQKPRFLS